MSQPDYEAVVEEMEDAIGVIFGTETRALAKGWLKSRDLRVRAEARREALDVFSECEGKLRAAATILDCEAMRAEKDASGAPGLREAAEDLRGAAERAGLARIAAERAAPPPLPGQEGESA